MQNLIRGLLLHCLSMFHKKTTGLKWVKRGMKVHLSNHVTHVNLIKSGPEVARLFFMFNSTEPEISPAYEN